MMGLIMRYKAAALMISAPLILIAIAIVIHLVCPYFNYPDVEAEYIEEKLKEYESYINTKTRCKKNDIKVLVDIISGINIERYDNELKDIQESFSNSQCPDLPYDRKKILEHEKVFKKILSTDQELIDLSEDGLCIESDYRKGYVKEYKHIIYKYANWRLLTIIYAYYKYGVDAAFNQVLLTIDLLDGINKWPPMMHGSALLTVRFTIALIQIAPKMSSDMLTNISYKYGKTMNPIESFIDGMIWKIVHMNINYNNSKDKNNAEFVKYFELYDLPWPTFTYSREMKWYNYAYIYYIEYYKKWYKNGVSGKANVNLLNWDRIKSVSVLGEAETTIKNIGGVHQAEFGKNAVLAAINKIVMLKKDNQDIDINMRITFHTKMKINNDYGCCYNNKAD